MSEMLESRVKLSPLMFFAVLFVTALGMAYLFPPYQAAKYIGPGAYLAVIGSSLLMLPFVILLPAIQRRFPEKNLLGAAAEIFGSYIGTGLNIVFLTALVFITIFFVRNTLELITTYTLSRTPRWAVLALMMTTAGFLAKDGLVRVSRLAGFVFFPVVFLRLLMLFLAFQGLKAAHLLPVISAGPMAYLRGSLPMMSVYIPWVVGVVFIYPLLSKPSQFPRIIGGLLAGQASIAFLSVLIMIGVFGTLGVQSYTWPVFEAVRRIDIPILTFQQFGLFFLIAWFTMFLVGFSFILAIFSLGLKQQFDKLHYRWSLLIIVVLMMAGVLGIPNLFVNVEIFAKIRECSVCLIYIYPLLIYIASLFKGKGVRAPWR